MLIILLFLSKTNLVRSYKSLKLYQSYRTMNISSIMKTL